MRDAESAKGRGPRAKQGSPLGDGPSPELRRALKRLEETLQSVGHPRAAEVSIVLALAEQDPAAFWRAIDANAWWAGAGSLAAETLADNPGLPGVQWDLAARELRACLIEIGEALLKRDRHNPGISSWILAFRNWSDSGV
jgi:hypothetical protein